MTLEEMKRIKEERGFSCRFISEHTGVPFRTVQKIFSGETRQPNYLTMGMLENLFSESALHSLEFREILFLEDGGLVVREKASEYSLSQGKYTEDDLKNLPENERYELIDGELFRMESPDILHQRAVYHIATQFSAFIAAHEGSCEVFMSPVDVHLTKDKKNVLVPDLCVVCDPDKIKKRGIWGGPDFVLEITSSSTRKRDLITKTEKYERAGVREYWILDLQEEKVITYLFDQDVKVWFYGSDEDIPVSICNGELKISLLKIREWILKQIAQRLF